MSIKKIMGKISIIIVSLEIFIMELFDYINFKYNGIIESIVDGSLLMLLSTPIIYFWVILPYIKEKNLAVEKNYRLAFYDSLTGIKNREYFLKFLENTLTNNNQISLILIDIDDFKDFNNNYGHNTGDIIIKLLSEKISNFSKNKNVFKISPDQFMIVLENKLNEEELLDIAKENFNIINMPIKYEENTFLLSSSIGISIYPKDATNKEELLKCSQIAMRQAKKMDEEKIVFYLPEYTEQNKIKFELQKDLKKAVENNELYLLYQPKINSKTKEISGVEALIRWNHPKRGFISPSEFIPLAEENGEILKIGKWVLEEAFHQFKIWEKEGREIQISVNFSSRQLTNKHVEEVCEIINKSEIPTKFIELEITETFLMKDPSLSQELLEKLKLTGVSLSIDDFGSGYSSLGYLKKFDMDVLKIDISLIKDICKNKDDLAIVKSIIAMGHILDMKIVAEGVETEIQANILKDIDCDYLQGYYYSKPVKPNELKCNY